MNKTGIVSPRWLNAHPGDRDLIIIDCRFQLTEPQWGHRQYLEGHIPGAHYLHLDEDLSSPPSPHGGRHPLPDLARLSDRFAEIGILKNESHVVLYDSSRLAFAARAWWLLRYLGHDRVSFLDGGWPAYLEGGYPVTADLPITQPGYFVPTYQPDWLTHRDGVIHRPESTLLIDSREVERYEGKTEPIDPIAGHIPGALNAPWQRVTDEKGYILPPAEQKGLWSDYSPDREMILYCGSGVTACVNLFSLEMAGYDDVKLYPGGWSDWVSYLIPEP
ncbi:MAG: putative thiosulfate sulfurtransferase SseB [Chroococcopsis gigantea SAG 12.99]|jgi:thiosulfate/3-mercaptopyruvate sulfurtransferase|nr:putative thiosulfate sulfurtransferase SseB [Chroococcopsis gigantea SAG 12.99]